MGGGKWGSFRGSSGAHVRRGKKLGQGGGGICRLPPKRGEGKNVPPNVLGKPSSKAKRAFGSSMFRAAVEGLGKKEMEWGRVVRMGENTFTLPATRIVRGGKDLKEGIAQVTLRSKGERGFGDGNVAQRPTG